MGRKRDVRILEGVPKPGVAVAIAYRGGRAYAATYNLRSLARGVRLDEDYARKDYRDNPRLFRPYDESMGCYL